jgi:hypothetical protein
VCFIQTGPHYAVNYFLYASGILRINLVYQKNVLEVILLKISFWRPGLAPGSVHVKFAEEKVALGQVYLQVLPFSPSITFHWGCTPYIISGMNGRPDGGRSSETYSHPIDMNNKLAF